MYNVRYEVISPYSPEKMPKKIQKITLQIISQFTKKGEKFYPRDLIKTNEKIIKYKCSYSSFRTYHYKAL